MSLRLHLATCWLIAALCALGGCQSEPRAPQTEEDAARAAGLEHAIVFTTEGGAVDVADSGVAGVNTTTLTLADAVRRALTHSPEIQSSLARVRIAQAEAKQARLLPNPIVSVIVRFPTEGGGSPEIEAGLAANLIALLRRPGQIDAADSRLRAASANAVSQVLDVIAEVQQRYAAVQAHEQLLVGLEERRTILDRLLQLSEDRLRLGEGTRLDALTLRAQRVELETEVAERRLQLGEERLVLSRLIGQPSGAADWQVIQWTPVARDQIAESQWITAALERRPEIQAKEFELGALGAEVRVARYAAFGDAEIGAEAERADDDWSIGPAISAPLPLFDWGQAQRKRTEAAVIEARHELTRLRRQVVEETRRAYASLAASQLNLDRVRDQLIPLQTQRRDQAEAQWRGGQTDITSLLVAEVELRDAHARRVELEQRVSDARYRLHRAVGGAGVAAEIARDHTAGKDTLK